MSYSVSGSVNLAYPGVNAQDYYSWQVKDTMTFNVGNHTLKWGYEFIRPVFEFNLALLRTASFTGNPDGQRRRGFHDRGLRQLHDRIRHCRPQPVHGEAPGLHRGLVQGPSPVHAELRPSLRAVHPVRSERRPPHHLGAGRPVHSRAGRAERHPVPRRSGAAVAPHEQRSEQFRAAARRRVGRARRCQDHRPRRVRHLLPADQRRDHARGRGTVARDHAASLGPDRRSVRVARAGGAAAGVAGPVRLLARSRSTRGCAARCTRCRSGSSTRTRT